MLMSVPTKTEALITSVSEWTVGGVRVYSVCIQAYEILMKMQISAEIASSSFCQFFSLSSLYTLMGMTGLF